MHKTRTESQKGRAGIKVTKVLVLGGGKDLGELQTLRGKDAHYHGRAPTTEQKQNSNITTRRGRSHRTQ